VRVLIDTNIVLDLALIREPFYEEADLVFALIEQQKIQGYISATTFSDLYYILRKKKGKKWTLIFLKRLKSLCEVNPIDDRVISQALNNNYKDFEDDIQYYSALVNNLDALLTRNPKDFRGQNLLILTPSQLIKQIIQC
jgi:predicted nucleic acid-binding protein